MERYERDSRTTTLMKKDENRIVIRVYGILIDAQKRILVSDEKIQGQQIVKFPGGGLEFGESLIDCLKREFKEETGQAIEIIQHFYTTDFFQESAFNKKDQIISVYYLVKSEGSFKTSTSVFNFENTNEHFQSLRWLGLDELQASSFTLPIDQYVGNLISKSKNLF